MIAKLLIEAAAALVYMLVAVGAIAVCEHRDRLKRRARLRALRRKHMLERYEDECQSRMARRIWELEDINAELSSSKASQKITIKGYGAAKLSEVLAATSINTRD